MSSPTSIESAPQRSSHRVAEFHIVWHTSAPDELHRAYVNQEWAKAWRLWQEHLASRKRPRSLMKLVGNDQCPLLWAVPDELSPGEEPQPTLADRIGKLLERDSSSSRRWREIAKLIEVWLEELDVVPTDVEQARDTLAVVHALPRLASIWDAATWLEAHQQLVSIAREAVSSAGSLNPLAWQLWGGELPLTLAYLFPEIEACRALGELAGQILSRGMTELLDAAGLPPSLGLAEIPQLVACWTRCHALVDHVDEGQWDTSAQDRYQALVRHLLQLMRDHRECLLVSHTTKRMHLGEMLAAAAKISDNRKIRRVAKAVLHGRAPRHDRFDAKLAPSFHDPVTKLAVLRTTWDERAPRLAVRYQGRDCAVELYDGRETLVAGLVETQVTWNGQRLSPVGDWEEALWESDADVDYLELELPLSDGVRLQRHLLLAREDLFLFWADAILGPVDSDASAAIDARFTLPLGDGIEYHGEAKTRDGWLVGRKPRARVMPLGLPEWCSDHRFGELVATDTTLELQQTMPSGRGVFLPLFIDLDPRRAQQPNTWRRLTVADNRVNVTTDVASGFRVQIGASQWLFYRSLVRGLSRTLLGHHLLHEFFAGTFSAQGKVEQLLAVESEWGSPD
ncbi:MAG: hypothetical protein JNM18_09730 [Planctomycetaceae bacterium]|nr:hypothetical protein [Planctomycetaceae bacterium]